MPVDVALWQETVIDEAFPHFPCPSCVHGRLSLRKDSCNIMENKSSKDAHTHDAWDPEWIESRFIAAMDCSNPTCGEVVTVCGDVDVEQGYDDEGRTWNHVLTPKAMFPPPPIVAIGKRFPNAVKQDLHQAFALFWVDLSACANRIRTALERVMDDKGIKKFAISKSRRRVHLALAARIKAFEQKFGAEHSHIFEALRDIGNLGSHSGISRTGVLAGFNLIEHVLNEIYEKPGKAIRKLAKTVHKKKGRLK